jgi:hypothetical protein
VRGGFAELAADATARIDRALHQIASGHSARSALLSVFSSGASSPLGERSVDAVGLIAMFGVDAVAAPLLARVADIVPPGLSDAARRKRLAEIADEVERLEYEEEAAIVAGEDAGMPVARRDDASLEIILACATPARPAAASKRALVPADVEADVVEHNTKRARERLTPAPARSMYLQRSKGDA